MMIDRLVQDMNRSDVNSYKMAKVPKVDGKGEEGALGGGREAITSLEKWNTIRRCVRSHLPPSSSLRFGLDLH
jgi:hypothetical protein